MATEPNARQAILEEFSVQAEVWRPLQSAEHVGGRSLDSMAFGQGRGGLTMCVPAIGGPNRLALVHNVGPSTRIGVNAHTPRLTP